MPLGGHELLINHWDMPYRLKQASPLTSLLTRPGPLWTEHKLSCSARVRVRQQVSSVFQST